MNNYTDCSSIRSIEITGGVFVLKNIAKIVALAVTMIVLALLFAGCGSGDSKSAVADIKKKGKLVVGTASGYYPFEMADRKSVV